MSQYILKHPVKPIILIYGYDPPLQHYFGGIIHSGQETNIDGDSFISESEEINFLMGISKIELLDKLDSFEMPKNNLHYHLIKLDEAF